MINHCNLNDMYGMFRYTIISHWSRLVHPSKGQKGVFSCHNLDKSRRWNVHAIIIIINIFPKGNIIIIIIITIIILPLARSNIFSKNTNKQGTRTTTSNTLKLLQAWDRKNCHVFWPQDIRGVQRRSAAWEHEHWHPTQPQPRLVGGLVAIFIFLYIGNVIIPSDEVIFFRGVAQPPTSNPVQEPCILDEVITAIPDITAYVLETAGADIRSDKVTLVEGAEDSKSFFGELVET